VSRSFVTRSWPFSRCQSTPQVFDVNCPPSIFVQRVCGGRYITPISQSNLCTPRFVGPCPGTSRPSQMRHPASRNAQSKILSSFLCGASCHLDASTVQIQERYGSATGALRAFAENIGVTGRRFGQVIDRTFLKAGFGSLEGPGRGPSPSILRGCAP